jgi:hypothetical protein
MRGSTPKKPRIASCGKLSIGELLCVCIDVNRVLAGGRAHSLLAHQRPRHGASFIGIQPRSAQVRAQEHYCMSASL